VELTGLGMLGREGTVIFLAGGIGGASILFKI